MGHTSHSRSCLCTFIALLLSYGCLPPLTHAYRLGFNCGATEPYVALNGWGYEPDQLYTLTSGAGYIGGETGRAPGQVKSGGTRDYDLYLHERRGVAEYRFDVPNGPYLVKLHFSETEHLWRTLRMFDVWIEDRKALSDFDPYDRVQRNYVIDFQFATSVTDGQLNVRFWASRGEPMVSAIYVQKRSPDSVSPSPPAGFTALDGFRQVILDWKDGTEDDIGGYEISRTEEADRSVVPHTFYVPSSRFIDETVAPYRTYHYTVRTVDAFGNRSGPSKRVTVTPKSEADSRLPVYELITDESHLAYLSQHVWDDVTIPVIFRYAGETYPNARMRYRGGASRRQVLKPSIKLIFADDQLFQGRKKLNLQSDTWDASLMRSKLAFDEYRLAGALAPAAEWVHLKLNGRFIGVYTAVDQIDERFLMLSGRPATGNIYKPHDFLLQLGSEEEYERLVEKETNRGQGIYDMQLLVEQLHRTPPAQTRDMLTEMLHVDEYLNWYCANQLLSNWDIAGHNYYLHHNLEDGQWEVIGWDPDVSYVKDEMPPDEGTRNSPMYGEPYWWDRLLDKVLSVPQFRRLYGLRLLELLDTTFSAEARLARVNDGHAQILFDAERDTLKPGWHENDVWFYPSLNSLRRFVTNRDAFLRASIREYIPSARVHLLINEFSLGFPGRNWIELYNTGPEILNLTGITITDNHYEPNKWDLPQSTMQPYSHMVLREGEFRPDFVLDTDANSIGLYTGSAPFEHISLPGLDLTSVASYGRFPDGATQWSVLAQPSPGTSNSWHPPVVLTVSDAQMSRQATRGASLVYSLTLHNQTAEAQKVVLQDQLLSVDGRPYTAYKSTRQTGIQLPAKSQTDRVWPIQLPRDLPLGIGNRFVLQIGLYSDPDTVWDSFSGTLSVFSRESLGHLVINELMADNRQTVSDEYGEYNDWVEIYNGSEQSLNLDGMYLSDDRRNPTKWQIRGISIAAREFVIFWIDGDEPQGTHHAGFRLSASGEGIGIFDTDENGNGLIDWVAFGIQLPGVSYGRYPDGARELECFRQPTPGEPNLSSGGVSVIFNELMNNNVWTLKDSAGEHDPWIELFNPGCDLIHLNGWTLSDSEGHRWLFPDVIMPPGTYLLLWADAQPDQGNLHVGFRLSPEGGTVSLHRPGEAHAVDSVQYDNRPPGESLGRYPNGVGNWVSLLNPSPGAENRLTKLVINEVMARNRLTMADEAGEYDDWVELYNPTDQPVFVGGLYLSDSLNSPTQWQLPGVEVPPRGFLLIWTDSQPEQGELHANFSLTGTGETITLFDRANNGHAVLDSVEFWEQESDTSYGRYPDGSSIFERFRKPTPGMPNVSSSITRAGSLTLLQNYPNPFSEHTTIPYVLSEPTELQLDIYSVQGQLIRRLELGAQSTGTYVTPERAASWSGETDRGERAAPGVYFYTLRSGKTAATRKLVLRR